MEIYKNYDNRSVLSPYINDLLAEKRSLGFLYNDQAYQLHRLDEYWYNNGFTDAHITPENISGWLEAFPGESRSSQSSRVGAAKCLAQYLISIGISCYIPIFTVGIDHNVVHVLSKAEINEFFQSVDEYTPDPCIKYAAYNRTANEYPIIFRLLYCCGMRIGETCTLETSSVNLENGTITILNGKRQKDRIVYLPDDLNQLLNNYFNYLQSELGFYPFWFFPGLNPKKPISISQVEVKFNEFWNKTPSSKHCDRKPTPHCLRHTFVVDRINRWVLAGLDIDALLPYLCKYLGHKNREETFYYYHLVDEAFKIIRQKDTMAKEVIPEVKRI